LFICCVFGFRKKINFSEFDENMNEDNEQMKNKNIEILQVELN